MSAPAGVAQRHELARVREGLLAHQQRDAQRGIGAQRRARRAALAHGRRRHDVASALREARLRQLQQSEPRLQARQRRGRRGSVRRGEARAVLAGGGA